MNGSQDQVHLQGLDYAVMGAYMLALLAMGAYLRKRAGKDLESYFLAGRKVPGWLNGCSYAATCMNADVAPAYCGMTVITGTFICWWCFSRFGLALMIGGVLFAVVVATTARNVIDISIFMLGLSSAELTANWAQWWWRRFNGWARSAASSGGPLVFLFNQFVVFRYFVQAGPGAVYLVVFASMAATCLLCVLVALLTEPEPRVRLVEFYRRARPLDWWGPIAREAGITPVGPRPIVRGMGIAALGAIMVGSGIIALSCAYGARWHAAVSATLVCAVAGLAFRRSFSGFVGSLEAGQTQEQ